MTADNCSQNLRRVMIAGAHSLNDQSGQSFTTSHHVSSANLNKKEDSISFGKYTKDEYMQGLKA
jgi:hypothetical protein